MNHEIAFEVTGEKKPNQLVGDADLIESYDRTRSIYKTADELGIHGSSVHERLQKLGVLMEGNGKKWTPEDDERLRRDYILYREMGRVSELAADMGRTVYFLSRNARRLGLTKIAQRKLYSGKWKYMSQRTAQLLWDDFRSHPRWTVRQFCEKRSLDAYGFSKAMQRFFPDEWEPAVESKTTKQSKYRVGRAFEYRVRDDLRKRGYFVLRSPMSKSPTDLIAIRMGETLFVQCKRGGQLPPGEWNELYDLAQANGAVPIMAQMPVDRGIVYWLMTGRKVPGRRMLQPMVPWEAPGVRITVSQRGDGNAENAG